MRQGNGNKLAYVHESLNFNSVHVNQTFLKIHFLVNFSQLTFFWHFSKVYGLHHVDTNLRTQFTSTATKKCLPWVFSFSFLFPRRKCPFFGRKRDSSKQDTTKVVKCANSWEKKQKKVLDRGAKEIHYFECTGLLCTQDHRLLFTYDVSETTQCCVRWIKSSKNLFWCVFGRNLVFSIYS